MDRTEKPNILLVDDRPENLVALEKILRDPHLNIMKAESGNKALGLMLNHDFALVLLDVQMPDMDGFETAELIREDEKTKYVPIIFVTAIDKEQTHVFKGYQAGAVDYLTKPLNPDILKSKVNVILELYNQRKELERLNENLQEANRTIREQQKSVIEEERLKVLFQMAGATAHELNQPLMTLLGNIELMVMNKDKPEKLYQHMSRVEEAGTRIAKIVKKIQGIRHYETIPYLEQTSIIKLDQNFKLLTIQDSDNDFDMINSILKNDNRIDLYRAIDIKEAIHVLKQDHLDLIFSEYFLSDGNGLDLLRRLETEELEIPVVIISDKRDEMIATQIIQSGAYDYLTKDRVNKNSLSRVIVNTMEKARLKRGVKESQAKIAEMSIKDELTGLFNRLYFYEALDRELSRAEKDCTDLALCMIDLDHFKKINDDHGHLTGDMVLVKIAKLLKECISQSDLICRYGGKKFTVILPNMGAKDVRAVSERFRELVARHKFEYRSSRFNVTVSVGIASFRYISEGSPAGFVSMANLALYRAKELGRNRIIEYGQE